MKTVHDTKQYYPSILIGFVLFIITILYFLPLLIRFESDVLPSNFPDIHEFVWNSWWVGISPLKELFFTKLLFAPEGASLLLHTLCHGLFLPLSVFGEFLSPVWKVNAAFIICFLINGISAVSLTKSLVNSTGISLIVGCVIMLHPALTSHLAAGHLNFVAIFPLLEVFRYVFLHLTSKERSFSDLIRLTTSIFLLPHINLYYFYFAAVFLGIIISLESLKRSSRHLNEILLIGTAILVNSVYIFEVAELAKSGMYTNDHNAEKHSADIAMLISPRENERLVLSNIFDRTDLKQLSTPAGEQGVYLGIVALILAASSFFVSIPRNLLAARWFAALCGVVFGVLSLGPNVRYYGETVLNLSWIDSTLRLSLPFYPSVPARFAILTALLTLLLSSITLESVIRKSRLLGFVATLLLVIDFFPSSIKVFPTAPPSKVLIELKSASDIQLVLDPDKIPQSAMYRQTIHGKPITAGFLSRRPKKLLARVYQNQFVRWLRGRQSYQDGELIRAWCNSTADALLISAADADQKKVKLLRLGFVEKYRDEFYSVSLPLSVECKTNYE